MSAHTKLFELVKNNAVRRLVLANGVDNSSLEAVSKAVNLGLVSVCITGDETKIADGCSTHGLLPGDYAVYHADNAELAVLKAVELVHSGKADLIMKGLVNTDTFMRAILDKHNGLLPKGALLSHVSMIVNPQYHKPLFVSDVAIIPLPTLEQKAIMLSYLIKVAQSFGIERPKVAFIAASEKVIEKMTACTDAALLKEMWVNGDFPSSVCEGPMAFDLAVDKEAAAIKNYTSPVAGEADCLLFPNIETGNVFYKLNTRWCKAEAAAIVMGTEVPVVLSSRGDTMQTKLNSIAFAAITA